MYPPNKILSKEKQSLLTFLVLLLCLAVLVKPSKAVAQTVSADTVITVTMKNFKFEPARLAIPAGEEVMLKFRNKGSVVHAFMAGNGLTEELEGYRHSLFSGLEVTKKVNGETIHKTYGPDENLMLGVKPGHTAMLTFTLPEDKKGDYEFGCFKTKGTAQTKHYNLGMKGTIEVTGPMMTSR